MLKGVVASNASLRHTGTLHQAQYKHWDMRYLRTGHMAVLESLGSEACIVGICEGTCATETARTPALTHPTDRVRRFSIPDVGPRHLRAVNIFDSAIGYETLLHAHPNRFTEACVY